MTFAAPEPLTANEDLFRQVHPAFIHSGRVSSTAFRPTPKDQGKLSVSRASRTNPKNAYRLHVQVRGLRSTGVWAITVSECREVDLNVFPDELEDDPAHAVIDFGDLSHGQAEKKAKKLAARARARGCLYSETPGR